MQHKEIDAVKLNIEGAELEILRDGSDWLKRVKAVIMELHPATYGYKGVKEIVSILSKNGFVVDYISKEIDTRRALQKWLYYINPNPPWLILSLWKILVTIFRNNIKISYLFAKNSMKILIVVPRYYPHIGGVEYVVKSITKRLAKTGYIITIVTIEPSIDSDRHRK